MMKKIMMRNACNDFEAMKTAEAMASVDADVFSITSNKEHHPFGAIDPHMEFIVWAKVTGVKMIEDADIAIGKEVFGE